MTKNLLYIGAYVIVLALLIYAAMRSGGGAKTDDFSKTDSVTALPEGYSIIIFGENQGTTQQPYSNVTLGGIAQDQPVSYHLPWQVYFESRDKFRITDSAGYALSRHVPVPPHGYRYANGRTPQWFSGGTLVFRK